MARSSSGILRESLGWLCVVVGDLRERIVTGIVLVLLIPWVRIPPLMGEYTGDTGSSLLSGLVGREESWPESLKMRSKMDEVRRDASKGELGTEEATDAPVCWLWIDQ